MEIINVDARTWELIMKRIEALADKTENLCRNTGDKSLQKWLDNQEVCQLLGISKRTLQTYRDNGTLPTPKSITKSTIVRRTWSRRLTNSNQND